jgi:F-type H+-transporting ATPase subunit b
MELYPLDILIHIVNIVVTYVLLRVLLYKPVRRFMDERAEKIAGQMEHAKELEEAAKARQAQYDEQIAQSEQQAREILRQGEQKALEAAEGIKSAAREQADQVLSQARQQAEQEKTRAMEGMQEQVAQAAAQIAGRILQREVSLEDNRRVVNEFFHEVK